MTLHPAIQSGCVAVITGGASGIGLAAAKRLAAEGMQIVIADANQDGLKDAKAELEPIGVRVETEHLDVGSFEAVRNLEERARELGSVTVLMNNAGVGGGGSAVERPDAWRRVIETNLFGVINGCQAFAQAMIDAGCPGMIVNTGSKQGITTPPGDECVAGGQEGGPGCRGGEAGRPQDRLLEVPVHGDELHLPASGHRIVGQARCGLDPDPVHRTVQVKAPAQGRFALADPFASRR